MTRPPYRLPFRYRWQRPVDRAACRLVAYGHHRAAALLWRAFRLI